MGWVSILKRPQLRQILEIPPHIIPVAYLCLGYPLEFPKDPVLQSVGWRDRLPLANLVHYNGWTGPTEPDAWQELRDALAVADDNSD